MPPRGAKAPPTREQLRQEVESVLSLRSPSSVDSRSQQVAGRVPSSKLLPRTPSQRQASGSEKELLVQTSVDDQTSTCIVGPLPDGKARRDQLAGAGQPDRLQQQAGDGKASGGGASGAGREWVADLASREQHGRHPGCWRRCRSSLRSLAKVVRAHPYTLAVALLTTALLTTAGVVGVLAAAGAEAQHRRDLARGFADNVAVAFSVQLQQTFAPLYALGAIIHYQPFYPAIAPRFNEIATELLNQLPIPGAVTSLQMSPQGVVRSFYPLEGNERAMNHDLFRDPERRAAALQTVKNRNLTMQGPVMLLQGWRGAIARVPLFVSGVPENETFGAPGGFAYNCTDVCWDAATATRFWGFVSCIVRLSDVATGKDARLLELTRQGYNYQFFAPQPAGEPIMISNSSRSPAEPVAAAVVVPNNEWTLLVAPEQGWVPGWRTPMLATVVTVSALVGLLVLATLVSRHQQIWLLQEMKATNATLADEKTRMDVLLARQYDLISCMAQQGLLTGSTRTASSLEVQTLDRIESMRREIGVASVTSGGDQLQLLELLGEGTFGKVFRGVWRGSTVAIKTMVLPAKMSGQEKRERMAIMEAAISSSMNHPNIVTTYTYTIKPATSAARQRATPTPSDQRGSASPLAASLSVDSSAPAPAFEADAGDSVHSFEVNLVLEYCDRGCLRDALDAGCFYSGGALNYAAILDTAADMAKAMLHLHCHQIIHSDLKLRNVLLKSDGSSERGCVAKVADFGLAVKMDVQDTHVSAFQGTMNMMAPESLLRGHISKACDVYSFGITLWELFTGGHAYHGVPRALLGHQVAVVGLRPAFPDFTPTEYRQLAQRCWAQDPDARPTFEEALAVLQRLRSRIAGRTPPLGRFVPAAPAPAAERAPSELGGLYASAGACSTQEQQRKVAAAQASGLVQMQSYYVDGSSLGSSMGGPLQQQQQHHHHHHHHHHHQPLPGQQQQQQQQQQRPPGQAGQAGGEGAGPASCEPLHGPLRSVTQLEPIQDSPDESGEDLGGSDGDGPAAAPAASAAAAAAANGSSRLSRLR